MLPHQASLHENAATLSSRLVSNFQPPVVKCLLNYKKISEEDEFEEKKWNDKAVKSLVNCPVELFKALCPNHSLLLTNLASHCKYLAALTII